MLQQQVVAFAAREASSDGRSESATSGARRADGAGLEHPVVPPHDVDPRRAAHDLCVFLVEKDNLNKCPFLAVRSLNLPTFLWSDTEFLECGTENRQFLNNLKIKGSEGKCF